MTGLLQDEDKFSTAHKQRHTFVVRKMEIDILRLGRMTYYKVFGKMK